MPYPGMWRSVNLVRTDVSEERLISIFRVEKYASERSVRRNSVWEQTSNTFLARVFLYPEDGGDVFLRNVGSYKIHKAPHPRIRHDS
jgi:hypothetical protein